MKKQTAVEWYKERLKHRFLNGDTEESIYEQAKALEKKQIIAANEDCSTNELGELLTGEQYYTSTYE